MSNLTRSGLINKSQVNKPIENLHKKLHLRKRLAPMEKLVGISRSRTYDLMYWVNLNEPRIIAHLVVKGNTLLRCGEKQLSITASKNSDEWGVSDICNQKLSSRSPKKFTVQQAYNEQNSADVEIKKTSVFYKFWDPTTYKITIKYSKTGKTDCFKVSLNMCERICEPTNCCRFFRLFKKKSQNDNKESHRMKLLSEKISEEDAIEQPRTSLKPVTISKNIPGNLHPKGPGDVDMVVLGLNDAISDKLGQRAYICAIAIVNFLLFGSEEIGQGHLLDANEEFKKARIVQTPRT